MNDVIHLSEHSSAADPYGAASEREFHRFGFLTLDTPGMQCVEAQTFPQEDTLLFGATSRPPSDWLYEAAPRMLGFTYLASNWDPAGAESIGREVVRRGIGFARALASFQVPRPFIVPTQIGGISFEWEDAALLVQVEFRPEPEDTELYYRLKSTQEHWEGPADESPRALEWLLAHLGLPEVVH